MSDLSEMTDLQRLMAFLDGANLTEQCDIEHYAPNSPETISILPVNSGIFYVQQATLVCLFQYCDLTFGDEGQEVMIVKCTHQPRLAPEACDDYQPEMTTIGLEVCGRCQCSEGMHK